MFKKIFKNISYLFASQIISKLLFLLQIIFIARFLGAEGLGKYAFVFSFGAIFFIFANFGLTDLTTRELSRDKSKTSVYLGNLFFIKIVSCLIASSLMITTIFLLEASPELRFAVLLVGIILSLDAFVWILYSIFRAHEKMRYEALIRLTHNIIIVGLVLLFLIKDYGIIAVLYAFVIGKAISLFLALFFTKKFARPLFKINFRLWKFLILTSIPFFVNEFFVFVIYRFDIIMLQIFKGSTIVGLYEAGYTIIRNLEIFPFFFVITVYPLLSQYFIKNKDKLQSLYKKSFLYLFLLSLTIVIACFFFGKPLILLIFGKEFAESVFIFYLISIGGFFLFLNLINIYYLNAINKPMINTYFFIFGTILNIVLNLVLIPPYSYIGAGIGTIVSYFVIFVGEFIYIKRLKTNLSHSKKFKVPPLNNKNSDVYINT